MNGSVPEAVSFPILYLILKGNTRCVMPKLTL